MSDDERKRASAPDKGRRTRGASLRGTSKAAHVPVDLPLCAATATRGGTSGAQLRSGLVFRSSPSRGSDGANVRSQPRDYYHTASEPRVRGVNASFSTISPSSATDPSQRPRSTPKSDATTSAEATLAMLTDLSLEAPTVPVELSPSGGITRSAGITNVPLASVEHGADSKASQPEETAEATASKTTARTPLMQLGTPATTSSPPPPRGHPKLDRTKQLLAETKALDVAGKLIEAEATARQVLAITLNTPQLEDQRGLAHGALGTVLLHLGRYEEALASLDEALAHAEQRRDGHAEGRLRANKGAVLQLMGKPDDAVREHTQSRDLCRQTQDEAGLGSAHSGLAVAYLSLGRYADATSELDESAHHFEAANDRAGLASVVGNRGNVLQAQGLYAKALELQQQYLGMTKDDKLATLSALGNLASVQRSLGQLDQAAATYNKQHGLALDVGDPAAQGRALLGLGSVYQDQGDLTNAQRRLDEALTFAEEIGDWHAVGQALASQGSVAHDQHDFQRALSKLDRAAEVCSKLQDKAGLGRVYGLRGSVFLALDRTDDGLRDLNDSLGLAQDLHDSASIGRAHASLGAAYLSLNQLPTAVAHLMRAANVARDINDVAGRSRALGLLGSVFRSLGEYRRGSHCLAKARELAEAPPLCDRVGLSRVNGILASVIMTVSPPTPKNVGSHAQAQQLLAQALDLELGGKLATPTASYLDSIKAAEAATVPSSAAATAVAAATPSPTTPTAGKAVAIPGPAPLGLARDPPLAAPASTLAQLLFRLATSALQTRVPIYQFPRVTELSAYPFELPKPKLSWSADLKQALAMAHGAMLHFSRAAEAAVHAQDEPRWRAAREQQRCVGDVLQELWAEVKEYSLCLAQAEHARWLADMSLLVPSTLPPSIDSVLGPASKGLLHLVYSVVQRPRPQLLLWLLTTPLKEGSPNVALTFVKQRLPSVRQLRELVAQCVVYVDLQRSNASGSNVRGGPVFNQIELRARIDQSGENVAAAVAPTPDPADPAPALLARRVMLPDALIAALDKFPGRQLRIVAEDWLLKMPFEQLRKTPDSEPVLSGRTVGTATSVVPLPQGTGWLAGAAHADKVQQALAATYSHAGLSQSDLWGDALYSHILQGVSKRAKRTTTCMWKDLASQVHEGVLDCIERSVGRSGDGDGGPDYARLRQAATLSRHVFRAQAPSTVGGGAVRGGGAGGLFADNNAKQLAALLVAADEDSYTDESFKERIAEVKSGLDGSKPWRTFYAGAVV
eukprot:m.392186 g.392186  ORF g.392186 m.392186 type:complete len:1253 (-) comp20084_c0_seq4:341-4099(-)